MKTANKRYDDCFALEMNFDGRNFYGMHDYNSDFNIHWTEVNCDDEETWNNKINELRTELEKRKLKRSETNTI